MRALSCGRRRIRASRAAQARWERQHGSTYREPWAKAHAAAHAEYVRSGDWEAFDAAHNGIVAEAWRLYERHAPHRGAVAMEAAR
jgi:hypothetical protein